MDAARQRAPHKTKVLSEAEERAKKAQLQMCCEAARTVNPLKRRTVEADPDLLAFLVSTDDLATGEVRNALCKRGDARARSRTIVILAARNGHKG